MTKEEMKEKAIAVIDKHRECYLTLGKTIYENPETGYRGSKKQQNFWPECIRNVGIKKQTAILQLPAAVLMRMKIKKVLK